MTVAKIWNGSTWLTPSGWNRPRIWNGSQWVYADLKDARGPSAASSTLTVGTKNYAATKFVPAYDIYGFLDGQAGSLSNLAAGLPWQNILTYGIYWQSDGSLPSEPAVIYSVIGNESAIQDLGWTSISFNGSTFTRSSATFQVLSEFGAPYVAQWYWLTGSNPFPSVGNTTTVNWT